jgi:hypothetical protein
MDIPCLHSATEFTKCEQCQRKISKSVNSDAEHFEITVTSLCQISGSHNCYLGCDAVSLDKQFLTLRGIIVPGVQGPAVQEQCLLYPEDEGTTLLQHI